MPQPDFEEERIGEEGEGPAGLIRSSDPANTVISAKGLCASIGDHGADEVLAQRLQAVVEEPITGDGWDAALGASIGTVTFDDGSVDAELLLARADEAMYAAKRAVANPLFP